ncbi:MAG: hypothetical protein EON93_08775 [Burkholderiales bacterium]|nr:MAG: hypothetical protein EON93_08775 [Burkholderiales bacterium]
MNARITIFAIAWGLSTCAVQAQTAGIVSFLQGEVGIRTSKGELRQAERGTPVETGDTVETGETARAQLRMIDGAYISLQPKTALRMDAYQLATATQLERGVMTLLRGGLRTITGLIGGKDRKNYLLNTAVATVGIRGTEFLVTADGGTRVRVAGGAVALCTDGGGCLHIPAGQTGFASERAAVPVRVASAPSLPPNPAPEHSATFALGEQRDYQGRTSVVSGEGASPGQPAPFIPPNPPPMASPGTPPEATSPVIPPPTGTALASGPGTFLHAVMRPAYPLQIVALQGTNTFDGQGGLSGFTDGTDPGFSLSVPTVAEHTADGVVAWGRWTSGTYSNPSQSNSPLRMLHYIAASNATTPTGSVSGTFTAFASTAPTLTSIASGLVLATGVSNSVTGTITLNSFSGVGGGTGNYTLNVPIAGQTYMFSASLAQTGSGWNFFDSSASLSITGTNCPCVGAVPSAGAMAGTITGNGPDRRIGGVYGFGTTGGNVAGAVVFR